MRGLVMVLMTIDHADALFASTHLNTDSVVMYNGDALPAGPYLTRWLTHLCAPTFLFLAGVSVALVEARGRSGLDRHLLRRGLLLMVLDPVWMWWAFDAGGNGVQVLFAIGVALVAAIGLRRLNAWALIAIGVGWLVVGEALVAGALHLDGGRPSLVTAFLLTGGYFPGESSPFMVIYPLLPWTAVLALGLAFGQSLASDQERAVRRLPRIGIASLLLFGVIRGINGYGNMALYRSDGSLLQWLHVSKYPPSASFLGLELGLMALCLAGFFALHRARAPAPWNPLQVFGQTALFFYLVHIHLLFAAASLLGVAHAGDLRTTYLATAGALIVLYPACLAFRAAKRDAN